MFWEVLTLGVSGLMFLAVAPWRTSRRSKDGLTCGACRCGYWWWVTSVVVNVAAM